jgi:C-terminal processing protease CtpA/Prc
MYPEWKDSIYLSFQNFQNDEIVRKVYVTSVKENTVQKKPDVRTLTFPTADSTMAVMKILQFSSGNYRNFYKKSFATLSAAKTEALVIDLRNNPGGSLREITYFYSFLTDSVFIFTDKAEVTSPYSCAFNGKSLSTVLAGKNILFKFAATLLYPIYYTTSSIIDLSVSKEKDGKYYYSNSSAKWKKPNKNRFTGTIYVLANGGSFSASCILLSNLQGSNRAFVVGEETGGAYNGTVAGRMLTKTLPASKLRLTVGMQFIQPYHKSGIEGRGIFPDKEIVPTIENRINHQDPEIEWIMNHITINDFPLLNDIELKRTTSGLALDGVWLADTFVGF